MGKDRLLHGARLLDELRFLLEGDQLFLYEGGSSGGGGGGDDDPPGGGGGSDDDPPGGGGGSDNDPPETLSLEEARKLRSENRNLRQRAKDAEDKLRDREGKDLTEQQRAERERDDERKRREDAEEENFKLRGRLAAINVGIRPKAAEAATNMIDRKAIDVDDDEALERAFKALKKEHEYLFGDERKPGDIDAGRRGDRGDTTSAVSPGRGRLRAAFDQKKT